MRAAPATTAVIDFPNALMTPPDRQRRGGGPVALPARAVTRHAILIDQLLRTAAALHGVLEALRLWRRAPRPLRRPPHPPRHENESGPSDDGCHRLPERAHDAS